MLKRAFLVAAVVLVAVPVAGAVSPYERVAGAGTVSLTSPNPPGPDITETDHFSVSGHSGPLGEDPSGQVTLMIRESTAALMGTTERNFHGDVKNGCVIVDGNRAGVVGELDEDDRFFVPSAPPALGPIRYVAVFVEDNDAVPTRPPDRAFPVLLFERTGQTVCSTQSAAAFYSFMRPLDSGNVVVHDAVMS